MPLAVCRRCLSAPPTPRADRIHMLGLHAALKPLIITKVCQGTRNHPLPECPAHMCPEEQELSLNRPHYLFIGQSAVMFSGPVGGVARLADVLYDRHHRQDAHFPGDREARTRGQKVSCRVLRRTPPVTLHNLFKCYIAFLAS